MTENPKVWPSKWKVLICIIHWMVVISLYFWTSSWGTIQMKALDDCILLVVLVCDSEWLIENTKKVRPFIWKVLHEMSSFSWQLWFIWNHNFWSKVKANTNDYTLGTKNIKVVFTPSYCPFHRLPIMSWNLQTKLGHCVVTCAFICS